MNSLRTVTFLLFSLLALACIGAQAGTISGRVTSLNGEPERGLTVRAQPDQANGAVVEATTDAQGAYTIQTQAGSCKVKVSSDDTTRIGRVSPETATVSGDAKSIDFIVFRRPSKFDITGEIVGLADKKHLATLEISVALASNPGAVVAKTTTLGKLNYFEFLNLPAETYILSVKTSLATRTYSFTSPSLTIALTSSVHVKPVVEISFKMSSVHEMQSNSVWNTILLISVIVALIYKDHSIAIARAGLKSIQTRNSSHIRAAIANLTTPTLSGAASFAPAASEDKSSSKKQKYPQKKEKTHVSTFVRYDSLPSSSTASDVSPPIVSPTPVREPKPEPVRAEPKKRAHTPAPSPVPTPAPAPVAVAAQVPAPAAVKPKAVPAPAVVKPAPVKAAPIPSPAPAPVVVPAPAPVATGGNKRPDANAKFCSECGSKY